MTLKDLQRKYAGTSAQISQVSIENVISLLERPKSWQGSHSADTGQVRRWLMHYLNLTSRELDNVLLAYFVKDHASEIKTTDSSVPTMFRAAG